MTSKETKALLDRWIELLSQSGKNTKQQVLEEMKIEREKYYELAEAIAQQIMKELGWK